MERGTSRSREALRWRQWKRRQWYCGHSWDLQAPRPGGALAFNGVSWRVMAAGARILVLLESYSTTSMPTLCYFKRLASGIVSLKRAWGAAGVLWVLSHDQCWAGPALQVKLRELGGRERPLAIVPGWESYFSLCRHRDASTGWGRYAGVATFCRQRARRVFSVLAAPEQLLSRQVVRPAESCERRCDRRARAQRGHRGCGPHRPHRGGGACSRARMPLATIRERPHPAAPARHTSSASHPHLTPTSCPDPHPCSP